MATVRQMKTLRLLLPKGSLNTPGRGDTCGMMKKAGYDILGYEPGRETASMRIANDKEIIPMLSRPQSAPMELMLGMADAAIVGSDWVNETQGRDGRQIAKVLDLGYGKTRLVFAASPSRRYRGMDDFISSMAKAGIICFSEYINTAAAALASCESYKMLFGDSRPMRLARGMTSGDNEKARVIMSDGVTEGYIAKGANLVVDNTQSGSTLKEYGLETIGEIGASSAGLYASAKAMETAWLRNKIEDLSRQLAGVVEGSSKYYVVLNAPKDRIAGVLGYARLNSLFADEPTIISGNGFCQVSLLIPKSNWPKISSGLAEKGARNIIKFETEQVMGEMQALPETRP